MKRFLLAAGLAVALHGLFLWTTPGWLKKKSHQKPDRPVVTLALAYYQSKRPEPKPTLEKPKVPPKKPAPVIEKKVKKPDVRPKPPKKVMRRPKTPRELSKPKKESLPEVIPDISRALKPEPIPELQSFEERERATDPLADFAEDIFENSILEESREVVSVSPVEVVREAKPMYLKNPPPEYPRLARRRGYYGTVVLEVLVDQEGRVGDLKVLTSSGYPVLDRSAERSVKKWLFEPGLRGDKRVEMWVKVPIRFELR